MKNKKNIITGIIIVLIIGVIISICISIKMKASKENFINVNLISVRTGSIYILSLVGNSMDNMQSNKIIYKDRVVLVLYDGNGKWSFEIELDKDADKIKRIYGSEAKKCEQLFREKFKNRLAPDFIVE